MHFHPNEMYLYYDPSTSTGKQVRAYASSINTHVNDFDITRVKLTSTHWEELLEKLALEPKQLLDKSNPEYQEKIRGKEFDRDGWVHVLHRNQHLVKAPIAVYQDRAILCCNATDILRLDNQPKAKA